MKKQLITLRMIAGLLLCLLAGAAAGTAQNFVSDVSKKGTTAAPFLSIGMGARAQGMGSAYVAVADDPTALYYNPAGVAGLPGIQASFDHTRWLVETQYNYMAVTVNAGDLGVIGASLTASNVGDMPVTTVAEPNGTGEVFTVSDVALAVTYARHLTDNFSIGFSPKFVSQSIWNMSATAFAIDMGIQYDMPFKGFTLGMAIANFGTKMKLEGNNALVLYDLDQDAGGTNERLPAYLGTEQWSLPLNFRMGVAYKVPLAEGHGLTLSVDAMHPSDNYESINIGGEYVFNDMIAFRGGMKSLFLKDSEEGFSLGVGVRQNFVGNVAIRFDYAYQDFGRLASVQKLTLGIMF